MIFVGLIMPGRMGNLAEHAYYQEARRKAQRYQPLDVIDRRQDAAAAEHQECAYEQTAANENASLPSARPGPGNSPAAQDQSGER
jgi:hypothetical protein